MKPSDFLLHLYGEGLPDAGAVFADAPSRNGVISAWVVREAYRVAAKHWPPLLGTSFPGGRRSRSMYRDRYVDSTLEREALYHKCFEGARFVWSGTTFVEQKISQ